MNISVSCGGTGGHIFPGLATARVLQARGHAVTLWLAGRQVEQLSVTDWTGQLVTVRAEGLSLREPAKCARALYLFGRAVRTCHERMRTDRPAALLAMGSYSSVGPVLAARSLRVPVVLHEANVIPGRAISMLARLASAVATGFPETNEYLRHPHLSVTGLPIRVHPTATPSRLREEGRFTVLVMGGSQGAQRLNQIASEAMLELGRRNAAVRVIHLAGARDEAAMRAAYARVALPHTVFGFLSEMEQAYGAADLAVCRSGASSCAELAAFGIPTLFVPFPHAARNHQFANARAMAAAGAADVIEERDLTPARLADYIEGMHRDSGKRAAMSAAARSRAMLNAAERLATLVEEVGGRSGA